MPFGCVPSQRDQVALARANLGTTLVTLFSAGASVRDIKTRNPRLGRTAPTGLPCQQDDESAYSGCRLVRRETGAPENHDVGMPEWMLPSKTTIELRSRGVSRMQGEFPE
jgi:hypothetical protein